MLMKWFSDRGWFTEGCKQFGMEDSLSSFFTHTSDTLNEVEEWAQLHMLIGEIYMTVLSLDLLHSWSELQEQVF